MGRVEIYREGRWSRVPLGAVAAGPTTGWEREMGGVREKACQGLQHHGGLVANSWDSMDSSLLGSSVHGIF